MNLDAKLECYCPICKALMNWHKGYGRECRCCGKECHDEWYWRYALSIMGKEYQPRQPAKPTTVEVS